MYPKIAVDVFLTIILTISSSKGSGWTGVTILKYK